VCVCVCVCVCLVGTMVHISLECYTISVNGTDLYLYEVMEENLPPGTLALITLYCDTHGHRDSIESIEIPDVGYNGQYQSEVLYCMCQWY
jgi:hypothetical protein